MTRLHARFALVFGLALSTTSAVTAAEPAPAPRLLYPRFDLTYLPTVGLQGVAGIRPAEIARHARGPELGNFTHAMLHMCLEQLAEGNLTAADPPAFADLDQCVFSLNLCITCPTPDEKGSVIAGLSTPCAFRTVRPFDWDGRVRKWFAKATVTRHAGRTYFRVPCRNFAPSGGPFGLFAPDDRTLVCGAESEIVALIDRLNDGRPAPAAPPGWAEVDRDIVALAFDLRQVHPVRGEWPRERPGVEQAAALLDAVQVAAVGLSVGERSGLRVLVEAKDGRRARVAATLIRTLLELAGEKMVSDTEPGPFEGLVTEALKSAALDRRGGRVTLTMSAEGNVVKMLLAAIRGPD